MPKMRYRNVSKIYTIEFLQRCTSKSQSWAALLLIHARKSYYSLLQIPLF